MVELLHNFMRHRTISYIDVSIGVTEEDDGFSVQLQCPILGIDATDTVPSLLSEIETDSFLSGMERLSRTDNPDREDGDGWLKRQGIKLGSTIFQYWQLELKKIMEIANEPLQGVRFNVTPSGNLANAIPWEVLCDAVSQRHLGQSSKLTIVRTTKSSALGKPQPIAPGESVRVLAVSASPIRSSSVHADIELPEIKTILNKLEQKRVVNVVTKPRQTWTQVCNELTQQAPHMLHIIAHGQAEGVVFEDNTVVPYSVVFDEISRQENLRVVIMNICNSRHLLEQDGLFGTELEIPSLNGIWAVLLNRTTISAEASKYFTSNLYQRLAQHHSLSVAVAHSRHRLRGLDSQSALQWSTPMLHLACDALPFPVSERLESLIHSSGPSMHDIQNWQESIEQFLDLLDNLHTILGTTTLPRKIELLSIPTKNKIIHDFHQILSKPSHSAPLRMWYNRSIRLAREAKEAIDECYYNIETALLSSEIHDEYKASIRMARIRRDIAQKNSSDLLFSIEELKELYQKYVVS